jgi:hypothetical protein
MGVQLYSVHQSQLLYKLTAAKVTLPQEKVPHSPVTVWQEDGRAPQPVYRVDEKKNG